MDDQFLPEDLAEMSERFKRELACQWVWWIQNLMEDIAKIDWLEPNEYEADDDDIWGMGT